MECQPLRVAYAHQSHIGGGMLIALVAHLPNTLPLIINPALYTNTHETLDIYVHNGIDQ